MSNSIAVIGLGAMGSRIAARLIAQGHSVTVYNRTHERSNALAEVGAQVAGSVADSVREVDFVITSLRGNEVELELAVGEHGFLRHMRPGALHLSMSTLAPAVAAQLANSHRENGNHFLACPVQGRPESIDNGQLAIWASGPRVNFDAAEPVLQALAVQRLWLGEAPEQAPAAKLAVNMLMFANIELFAEVFHYLRRVGVDPAPVAQVLTQTSFAAPLFRMITSGLLGDHKAQGTNLEGSLKDLRMLVEHAKVVQAHMPAAAAVQTQYERAAEMGFGQRAQTSVLQALDGSGLHG